ncbi:hypothetical protein GCM10025787_36480 [Saccharopolyspora rosea]|uniref:Uncharacterized protein n=1 Tax=Saccharopolyspora rosea TaxID=524884 RepID=A0ABW3FYE0_9PSEU
MKRLSPSADLSDLGVPEVDALLVAVTRDGFTLRYCNGPREPTLIVGTYEWGSWLDILVIRAVDDVISARIPVTASTDVFAPDTIVWAYVGDAEHALRALLELPHPDSPQAPKAPVPAPLSLHVPAAREAPVTVRPPTALAARARQIRLGAALLANTADDQTETGISR